MGVSGQGELDGGLPDVRVVQPLGCHHELDGLRQVGHLLLGVHRPVGPHAEVGVVADEAHVSAALTVLKPHCGRKKEKRRELEISTLGFSPGVRCS